MQQASALEVRGGVVLSMVERRAAPGSVFVEGGRIVAVGDRRPAGFPDDAGVIDASGCYVLPGLVQAHVHVCQTLCRGAGDDLPLLAWLRQRVWPYEAALDERAMRACARLAAAELLCGGTTAILDMGTVHETDALVEEIGRAGLRAVVGKAMMDAGDGVPARLRESTRASLDESDALRGRWSGAFDGRIGWAYAPRFVLSCSDGLLAEVAARVKAGARLHTHASEQVEEIRLVRAEKGRDNVEFLDAVGLSGPRSTLAHCVHVTAEERRLLARTGTHVAHCPSSNLKLASGVALVPEMLAEGVSIALGADGAPCNNNLDGFLEMRLAALLHKPRAGASAMDAWTVLELATVGGARALGLEGEVGQLAPGLRADLIVVDPRALHVAPSPDPAAALVYAARAGDVRDVVVDGRVLVRGGRLTEASGLDVEEVVARAVEEGRRVAGRADGLRA
jgi:cytosine/adenosine deaminase-related metal-dependent hydrolase